MKMTRRRFLGAAALTCLTPGMPSALAARFLDKTGLSSNSFIWQPSFAPSGPVTIAASLSQKLLYVFRGNKLLGIARCELGLPMESLPTGVFRLSSVGGTDKGHSWQGVPVFTEPGSTARQALTTAGPSALYLPAKFTKLLSKAAGPGSLFFIAPERTPETQFYSTEPFVKSVPSSKESDLLLFTFSAYSFSRYADTPTTLGTNIIISGKDRKAQILRSGETDRIVDVDITNPQKPLGLHSYCLTEAHAAGIPSGWLGFGLAAKSGAPQIARNNAQKALQRVNFTKQISPEELDEFLVSGAAVILTDASLKDAVAGQTTAVPLMSDGSLNSNGQHVAQDLGLKPTQTSSSSTQSGGQLSQNRSSLGGNSGKAKAKPNVQQPAPSQQDWWGDFSNAKDRPIVGPRSFRDP